MAPLALLMVGLPLILQGYAEGGTFGEFGQWAAGLAEVVRLALEYLFQAIAVGYGVTALRGRPARPDAEAAETLKRALPILCAVFLSYVLIIAGLVLLIVPGVAAFLLTLILLPVMVEERRGVIASLRRSYELSRGAAWRILGILLLALCLSVVVVTVADLLGLMQALAGAGAEYVLATKAVVRSGVAMLFAGLLALIYFELVEIREGSRSLTTVFA